MQPSSEHSTLAALLTEQRALETLVNNAGPGAEEAIAMGRALLVFAEHEDAAFSALSSLLDPAAQQELADEHQEIAADLSLLGWLLQTTPDSPDVPVLTASLLRRMRQHIDRDGRLLTRAAALRSSAG
jgi:hypothetical protein